MKKLLFTVIFAVVFTASGFAQLTFQNGSLAFGRALRTNYTTTWGGWAHYWGTYDGNGIKMLIHSADPRMATTTNKLVFLDSDRNLYIDLYCRTLYQTSDEKLKTNIQPLRNNSETINRVNGVIRQSFAMTELVKRLNPVRYQWKDAAEYERYNIRPVKTNVEEYGFIAQELENIIPGAVAMTEEGDRLVNYTALIPILTSAIQELTERVAALEAQLQAVTVTK